MQRLYFEVRAWLFCRGNCHDEKEKTSEFDGIGEFSFCQFFFEGQSIKHFNTAMFLEELRVQRGYVNIFQIVQIRWQAIQTYFVGNIEKCVEHLEAALSLAKETAQPAWVIKDILVDLRNQHWTRCTTRNEFYDTPAQKELTESDEELLLPYSW